MEKIYITMLGTGYAIPTPSRNHSAILCQFLNECILIDCGESTQVQFKKANLNPYKLTKLFITHWHGDHILGLPGLFQTLALMKYHKTLEIYGPKGTKKHIENISRYFGANQIQYKIHEVSSGTFIKTPEYQVSVSEMKHHIHTLAYSIELKDKIRLKKDKIKKLKLPNSPLLKELRKGKNVKINNKLIKASHLTYLEKGKKVTIILDTAINNNAIKLAKDSNLLITESSFSHKDEKKARESMHLTAKDCANIAKKAKAKQLLLTHISERYKNNENILLNEAKSIFKNVSIANDLQKIVI